MGRQTRYLEEHRRRIQIKEHRTITNPRCRRSRYWRLQRRIRYRSWTRLLQINSINSEKIEKTENNLKRKTLTLVALRSRKEDNIEKKKKKKITPPPQKKKKKKKKKK